MAERHKKTFSWRRSALQCSKRLGLKIQIRTWCSMLPLRTFSQDFFTGFEMLKMTFVVLWDKIFLKNTCGDSAFYTHCCCILVRWRFSSTYHILLYTLIFFFFWSAVSSFSNLVNSNLQVFWQFLTEYFEFEIFCL